MATRKTKVKSKEVVEETVDTVKEVSEVAKKATETKEEVEPTAFEDTVELSADDFEELPVVDHEDNISETAQEELTNGKGEED